MPGTAFQKNLTIALFRTLLHSFIRVYWRPSVRGAVPLPRRGPCFLYGNHANRWDPFILNRFTPWGDPTGGVMTQEFFRGSFVAWAMRNVDVHPTRKRIADPHLIRTIYRMLKAGRKIVIYPEAEHGFHADYRDSYNEHAAKDGWKRMLAWFAQHGVK